MGLGPIARSQQRGAPTPSQPGLPAIGLADAIIRGAIGVIGGDIAIGIAREAANLPGRTRAALQYQNSLRFPLDLLGINSNLNPYFMSLKFVKYEKRAIGDRKSIIDQGKDIYLPIPNQLNDTYKVNYSTESLGPMLGAFVESETSNRSSAETRGYGGEGILAQGLQNLLPSNLLNAVSAVSGMAINPFMTVVFKNPSFKSHSFAWKFMPKNEKETDELTKIITAIKYHMHPGLLTSTGVIFEYPEMLLIRLYPDDVHTYKFKPCVVTGLSMNYAPSGGPSFFKNKPGAPTAVEMRIELQEIEYFTKLDYLPNSTPTPTQPQPLGNPPSILPSIPGFSGLFGR